MDHRKKEDLRVKRTRAILSQSLFSLMEHHSFHSISVKDICKEAMVHRATFYCHFRDKYDLLAFSLKQIADEIHIEEGSVEQAHARFFLIGAKYKRLFSQLLLEEKDSLGYIIRQEMTLGMKQELLQDTKIRNISTSSEIVMAAFAGATLGILKIK